MSSPTPMGWTPNGGTDLQTDIRDEAEAPWACNPSLGLDDATSLS